LAVCLLLGCLLALSQRHSRGEDRHYEPYRSRLEDSGAGPLAELAERRVYAAVLED